MKVSMLRFLSIIYTVLLLQSKKWQYWALMLICAVATWFVFPSQQADYMVLAMDGYRGSYSSAWMGMIVSMLFIWLSLVGFYVIRGALYQDMVTKVWQLLVTTSLNRWSYLVAKWLGQMFTLVTLLLPVFAVAIAAQFFHSEDTQLSILELFKPFVLLSLPCIALMSAIAIVFDIVPWLRKTLGNVIYFVMWLVMLIVTQQNIQGPNQESQAAVAFSDPIGIIVFDRDLRQVLTQDHQVENSSHFCMVCGTSTQQEERLNWSQWNPPANYVLGRLALLFIALALVSIAALFLDKSASHSSSMSSYEQPKIKQLRLLAWLLKPLYLSPITTLIAVELQSILRTRSIGWWAILMGTIIVQMTGELPSVALALAIVWLLFIDVYSQSALKEKSFATQHIINTISHAQWRVYGARWASVVLLAFIFTLPSIVKYAATQPLVVSAIIGISVSMPTVALVVGRIFNTSRLFELYLCLAVFTAFEQQWFVNVSIDPLITIVTHSLLICTSVLAFIFLWHKPNATH